MRAGSRDALLLSAEGAKEKPGHDGTPVVESAGRSVCGGDRREGEQKPTRTHSGRKEKEQAIENRALGTAIKS